MKINYDLIKRFRKKNEAEDNPFRAAGHTGGAAWPKLTSSKIKILALAAAVVFVVALAVLLIIQGDKYNQLKAQAETANTLSTEIENDYNTRLAEVNEKYSVNRLKAFFSENDIYRYTTSLWEYKLLVNDKPVEDGAAVTFKTGDKISVKETRKASALPAEFINTGSLTRGDEKDSVANHITVSGKEVAITELKDGLSNYYEIEIKDFNKGNTCTINLSVQLAQRLGFKGSSIEMTRG